MEFLYSLDGGERVDNDLAEVWVVDSESCNVVGNVVEEVGEEGNFEDLIEGDELEAG